MWKKDTMIDDASGCWKEVPLLEATTPERQRPVIARVDQILAPRKNNSYKDISNLAFELDKLGAELYDLHL